jgi:Leucine-rich repeat (LRR) protein
MTEISFRLIRNKNSHLDIDKLEECDFLDLSNSNIETIDNLELFTHLKEINLSHNRITRIENLSLFHNLDFLDISSNSIDVTGLLQSYESIPRSLTTINLSGNPCILDEMALCDFADRFPDINIIVDVLNELEAAEEDKEQIDNYSHLVDANHGEDADYDEIAEVSDEPLTSDSVLKYIVDRKCKLQALGARFNLTSAVEVRNLMSLNTLTH